MNPKEKNVDYARILKGTLVEEGPKAEIKSLAKGLYKKAYNLLVCFGKKEKGYVTISPDTSDERYWWKIRPAMEFNEERVNIDLYTENIHEDVPEIPKDIKIFLGLRWKPSLFHGYVMELNKNGDCLVDIHRIYRNNELTERRNPHLKEILGFRQILTGVKEGLKQAEKVRVK